MAWFRKIGITACVLPCHEHLNLALVLEKTWVRHCSLGYMHTDGEY
jgi:hypothetical protein